MMQTELTSIHPFAAEASFSHAQVSELISLINIITQKTKQEINIINSRLSFVHKETDLYSELNCKLNQKIAKWSDKMRRLGATPIKPFKVEFPAEMGRFTWEYPAKEVNYFSQ